MPEGQIRKALSGFYYVYYQGETYQTRGRGNFRNRNLTPLVGDFVEFESGNKDEGILKELLERRNELVRPPIANIDLGVVVTSAVEPDFSPQLLDRFLVTLENKGIKAIIYITKTDLIDEKTYQELKEYQEYYESLGYTVYFPKKTEQEAAVQQLCTHFADQLTVFMGQSGAGKSTLLNTISPELVLKTAEISTSLGRGKHTTRHVELIPLHGGLVADTPGFSAIDLAEIELEDLRELFPEFLRVQEDCRFRGCVHLKEPKCKVKELVEAGEIADYRYANYKQFYDEISQRRPDYSKKK
ncbi:ribosome small subunit-dependent GTPase A [Desemzia incerta]|uniref:ribosome small subunit-dependent GTPase A n=1 Tax=Desemzia incerta TaxID=82801 RepID=UPI003315BDE6